MATVIRMSRGGAKRKPYYRIVATNSRSPRDSKHIERLGTYNPMLPKSDPKRMTLNNERIQHWLSKGAKPSETVARFLRAAGLYNAKPTFVPKSKGTGSKKKVEEAAATPAAAEAAPKPEAAAEKPAAE
jgi:small subunit ribosomal protein S16